MPITFSWSKWSSSLISRSVRFAVVSFLKTFEIFLMAHGSPWASSAEHTTPKEPQPTNFCTWYCESTVKSVPRTTVVLQELLMAARECSSALPSQAGRQVPAAHLEREFS
eukprot:5293980-Pleurochrysis_carterae.AAC.1